MPDESRIILPPIDGEDQRAEDALIDIQRVLLKHRMMLAVSQGVMALCVENRAEGNWRAIAQAEIIAGPPVLIKGSLETLVWRPIKQRQGGFVIQ